MAGWCAPWGSVYALSAGVGGKHNMRPVKKQMAQRTAKRPIESKTKKNNRNEAQIRFQSFLGQILLAGEKNVLFFAFSQNFLALCWHTNLVLHCDHVLLCSSASCLLSYHHFPLFSSADQCIFTVRSFHINKRLVGGNVYAFYSMSAVSLFFPLPMVSPFWSDW